MWNYNKSIQKMRNGQINIAYPKSENFVQKRKESSQGNLVSS